MERPEGRPSDYGSLLRLCPRLPAGRGGAWWGKGAPGAEASGLLLQFVRCAYVIILMAVYWCTEVIPLAVTSLMPALLFPLLKILDSKQVSAPGGPRRHAASAPWRTPRAPVGAARPPRGPDLSGPRTDLLTFHPHSGCLACWPVPGPGWP